jgi:threonine/homoserine/homoserine lactone efflux protein
VAIFYLILLPQFVTEADSVLLRTAQLSAIFLGIALMWLVAYSWLVACVGRSLNDPRVARVIETVSGTVLVGLGVRILATDR